MLTLRLLLILMPAGSDDVADAHTVVCILLVVLMLMRIHTCCTLVERLILKDPFHHMTNARCVVCVCFGVDVEAVMLITDADALSCT